MATILQAVKNIVVFSDAGDIYNTYMAEYGRYVGFRPKTVTEYMRSLPSIADFPFYDGDILSALDAEGVARKTTKGQRKLVDDYWLAVGYVTFQRMKKSEK